MITKSERVYFTNPIGTTVIPKDWDGAKVLVTRVRYPRPDTQVGDIVDVNGKYLDEKATLWYVTADGGRHVEGHVISEAAFNPYSRYRIGFLGDDLFALGSFVDKDDETKQFRLGIQRWSTTNLPVSLNSEYGIFNLGCVAAPWAVDLMPRPGESEDVTRAKVKQARVRWEQKQKAAMIVREGHTRGWLNLLETLNERHASYMGYPRFDLHVEGKVLMPVHTSISDETREEAQRHITGIGAQIQLPDNSQFYVSAPYSAMIAAGFTHDTLRENDAQQAFRNHARREVGDYSLDVSLDDHRFILSTLNS